MNRRFLVRSLACTALLGMAAPGFAQEWPRGPVRVVVPYAAGSTPDIVARVVSERLSARLGTPLVVENRAGAAGNLGTDAVAKAQPDGQTIGISISGPLAVNTLLFKRMPYDPGRDIEPLTIAATQPSVLVVSTALQVGRVEELLALLKKNPGRYNFSSMGAGTISHLAMEALAAQVGTQVVHVPYKGSGAAAMAVLAGEVEMAVLPAAAVMPFIKEGKLKGLAIAGGQRSAALPEFPTLLEAGVKDVQADAWMGFIAPARTPQAITRRLHQEIVQVLAEPAVRDKLRLQYMDVVANSPSEFRATLAADLARWTPVIRKHNITLD